MILLDSLHMTDPMSREPNIRRNYTRQMEGWKLTVQSTLFLFHFLRSHNKVVGKSGVFMLYYMFLFAMNAPKSFSRTSYPYFIDGVEIEDKVEGTKKLKIIKENTVNEERPSMEKRKARGPTYSHEVHGMESDKKNYVEWNNVGQPVGPSGRSLRTFLILGTMARNASKLPIDVPVWDKIPKHLIEDVWDFIKRRSEVNRKNKGVQKRFHCVGTQTFADIRKAEEKIQALKQSQSSASSSQTMASKYDIYSQVLGEDKLGRVRAILATDANIHNGECPETRK
ncbi:hypothetical protein Taro_036522, partial [Colocasia esculenta]|nr:hypothetical protein [Colocasia esculenta]